MPVVEGRQGGGNSVSHPGIGKLVGILTNRDVRFASADPRQKVAELDDQGQPRHPVREGVRFRTRPRSCSTSTGIEKILVVDDDYRCVRPHHLREGTSRRRRNTPNACKDERGNRLRVAAATGVGEDGFARAMALIEAECDVIMVDTAHGHSQRVLDAVTRIQETAPTIPRVAAGKYRRPPTARKRAH